MLLLPVKSRFFGCEIGYPDKIRGLFGMTMRCTGRAQRATARSASQAGEVSARWVQEKRACGLPQTTWWLLPGVLCSVLASSASAQTAGVARTLANLPPLRLAGAPAAAAAPMQAGVMRVSAVRGEAIVRRSGVASSETLCKDDPRAALALNKGDIRSHQRRG